MLLRFCLRLEVSIEKTLKSLAVTSLVAGHFVNGVGNGGETELLSELSKLELAHGSAVFSVNTHLEVLLGGVG